MGGAPSFIRRETMAKKEPAIIKRDSKENWMKSKYVPKENVIIIMDNIDHTISLMIGDGETEVNKLPDLLKDKVFGAKASVDDDVLVL
jgi:hypothetical protein